MSFYGHMKGKLAKAFTGKRKAKMSATGHRQPYRCQADGWCADTCLKNVSDWKGKECGHPCRNSQPRQSRPLWGAYADLHWLLYLRSLLWCCDRFITDMRVSPMKQHGWHVLMCVYWSAKDISLQHGLTLLICLGVTLTKLHKEVHLWFITLC